MIQSASLYSDWLAEHNDYSAYILRTGLNEPSGCKLSTDSIDKKNKIIPCKELFNFRCYVFHCRHHKDERFLMQEVKRTSWY